MTAHDGFTLADLVAYQQKHNEANLDDNRDGTDDNHSWNCGVEGPSDDPAINELRERQRRNLWGTLILAQGVPMICSGDEFGRTQQGNNNAYCQDNAVSWFDWKGAGSQKKFFDFACRIVALRRQHPSFRRRSFKKAVAGEEEVAPSVRWFRADGEEMGPDDWDNGGWMRTLGMFLDGNAPEIRDPEGRETEDNDFLLLLYAHHEPVEFHIPAGMTDTAWSLHFDTAHPDLAEGKDLGKPAFTIEGRSLVLLKRERSAADTAPKG